MPTRVKRLLIPLFIVLLFSLGRQIDTVGQAPTNNIFLPIVSYNLTGWIGPFGGSIISIAFDPTNPDIAYVGTSGSGIFKTIDGGSSWASVNNGLNNFIIYSLAVDPKTPSTVYAGSYHSQVFKSTNGGVSWSWYGTGMQDPAIVYSLVVDPVTPSVLYAGTRGLSNNGQPPWNGVVYKSSDGGLSWSSTLENVGGPTAEDWAYSLAVNPNKHQQVFAALHEHGAFRSDDAGATWHTINNGLTDLSGRSIIISPQPDYSSRLYYGVWHTGNIYKTYNSGDNWTGAGRGIILNYIYGLAVDPTSPDTVYISSYSDCLWKTTDAGYSWVQAGLQSDNCYHVEVNPKRTYNLLAGTAGDGLYRSLDSGTSWQRSNFGISNSMVTSLAQSPTVPGWIFSSIYGGGVYKAKSRSQNWEEMNKGLPDKYIHALVTDPNNPTWIYALTDSAGLYYTDFSKNEGWVKAGSGLPLTNTYQPPYPAGHPFATLDTLEGFANPPGYRESSSLLSAPLLTMVFAPSDPGIAYIGTFGNGFYRSADHGYTWLQTAFGGEIVQSIAVDITNADLIYAAPGISGYMLYSNDGGYHWEQVSLPVYFYTLAASPKVSGVVYAGTDKGIYRYQGGTFTSLGLTDQVITAIALDPRRTGLIYAGTNNGAYYSLDSGGTWNLVDARLNSQTILSISLDPEISNVVYFTTKTHGILLVTTDF